MNTIYTKPVTCSKGFQVHLAGTGQCLHIDLSSNIMKCTFAHRSISSPDVYVSNELTANASVKGNLELPLLKGRRRFDVETTSNLEVYIFRGW